MKKKIFVMILIALLTIPYIPIIAGGESQVSRSDGKKFTCGWEIAIYSNVEKRYCNNCFV